MKHEIFISNKLINYHCKRILKLEFSFALTMGSCSKYLVCNPFMMKLFEPHQLVGNQI